MAIIIKQSPFSGLAQALNSGIRGYRKGQKAGQQNAYAANEDYRKQVEFENDQQDYKRKQNALDGVAGALTTQSAFNTKTPIPVTGPADNYVANRAVPTLSENSQATATLADAFGVKDFNSLTSGLGNLQQQQNIGGAAHAAQNGDMSIANVLASLGGQDLKGQYSTNAQGLSTNALTGDTSIAAPGLYDSIVGENQAQAANYNASANQTNQRTPLELELLRAQAGSANRANTGGTSVMQNAIAAGYVPGTPEYQQFVSQNSGGINVNLPGEAQGAFEKELGKNMASQYQDIESAAIAANSQNAMLSRMEQLASGLDTGTGAGAMLALKKFGSAAFGLELQSVSDAEALNALGNKLALELRNPAGGAGMPGAMSDKDREFLVSSVPGLSKTPGGNLELIGYMQKVNQRSIEVAQMAREWVSKNKSLGPEFNIALQAWANENPIFPETTSIQTPDAGGMIQSAIAQPQGNPSLLRRNQPAEMEAMTATNPETGQKAISYDGGKTWQEVQ